MLDDDEEGEYLDDPISLIFDGVTDVIDLASSSDDDEKAPVPRSSYGVKSFSLPVTFFDISRNVKLLKECQPLSIKVVDCYKYPINKPELACEAKSQVSCDANKPSCDDRKLMKAVKETMSVNVGLDSEKPNAETNLNPIQKTNCVSRMEETDREYKETTQNKVTIGSKKVEQEKQQALKCKDLSRVDFKKNTGLVGFTITNKLGLKLDIHNRRSKKEKVSNEIIKDIGATLNNLGTEVIPLFNRNISDEPKNVTKDSQSNIPPKEASLVSTDAKDEIANNNENSPTRCSLKIKCSKLLEKAIKLKLAKESHTQEPPKTKSEINRKPNILDIIDNDHTVPKLNLKRRQSETDRNEFYIVDSNIKDSGCGTKNKTRKIAETKEEDKVVKNEANKDIPARSSSPILHCTTNINPSNQGKLKPISSISCSLTKMPNNNRKKTCAPASKSETKSCQKKLKSYAMFKNTSKKKNQCKTPIPDPISECSSVLVNNKINSSERSTNVAPKPDDLARIRRDKQDQFTKINSNKIITHAETLPGVENEFCVRTHQQNPKTKVTKTTDTAIVTSENLTGVEKDSNVRIYQHSPKNKATTPTDAAVPNENRVTSRDPISKAAYLKHKQREAGAALHFLQNVNNISPPGENYRRKEWRQALLNAQSVLNKTENYPTSNRPFYSNHPGDYKGPQPSPLQTSMHQIQGRPIETMINGRPHLYRQPESNALQGRPVRFLSPWPSSPFPPPNTNIALNTLPRILRPNSQICRMSYMNTANHQIPGHWWPMTPGNRCLPPPPPPLPPQQENGTSATPVRQVSKESVIGSNADGNPIKKIMLTNTINDKEKMLETLNSAIDVNLHKATEEKQEPMRTQTDPRLATKSKPCPLSKKANNNGFEPKIDQKTRDIPTSKACNFPISSYRQVIATAMNEKSCPLSKKPINSVQTKINQKTEAIPSYSPPILPIPSYQQAFEIIAKNEKHKMHNVFKEFIPLPNNSKLYSKITNKKGPREDQAKKISIEEYKKRIKGKDGVDKNNSTKRKCKNKNVPYKVALDNNQDLGYDSDATFVL